ncbi:MAG: hypothetical protein QUS66_14795 [Bacteroidota bacterium]|nr:hypothetical protein [Bacteroidota bacterium]
MIRADALCENGGRGITVTVTMAGNEKRAGRKIWQEEKEITGRGNDAPDMRGERQKEGRYGEG